MVVKETEMRQVEVLKKIVCDKCKKEFTDDLELQEFHHVSFRGGFNSVFGDGVCVRADICQNCWFEMIKGFAIIGEDDCFQPEDLTDIPFNGYDRDLMDMMKG